MSSKYKFAQSPINIDTSRVRTIRNPIFPLLICYEPVDCSILLNNGNTWILKFPDSNLYIAGGSLFHQPYQLDHIHCHWGESGKNGSEHQVDNQSFSGELHMVHRSRKYGSLQEAVEQPGGVAVIGVFLQETCCGNPELIKITDQLSEIEYKNQQAVCDNIINPVQLFPSNCDSFWCYNGSLTTPNFNETVRWILLNGVIPISTEQLNAMRALKCCTQYCDNTRQETEDCCISSNCRSLKPIGDRVVYEFTD